MPRMQAYLPGNYRCWVRQGPLRTPIRAIILRKSPSGGPDSGSGCQFFGPDGGPEGARGAPGARKSRKLPKNGQKMAFFETPRARGGLCPKADLDFS